MSPREFWNALEGWKNREQFRQRQEWERARYLAKTIAYMNTTKKEKNKVDTAFTLPWDKDGGKAYKKKAFDPEQDRKEMELTQQIISERGSK